MNQQKLLIIFTRNLIHGRVKTRLAATVGHDKAFIIYKQLIAHTRLITKPVDCDKVVYYSERPEEDDVWNDCQKAQQHGNDLGERMKNAFEDSFDKGYASVVIIGTDCLQINQHIITHTFEQLNMHDVVIGPALDGGYYLLGMKSLHEQLFENIAWSTETVFETTRSKCNTLGLRYFLLPVLSDIDDEKDLMNTDLK